jgi:hypothetical protein
MDVLPAELIPVILRTVVVPLGAAYAVFIGVALFAWRRSTSERIPVPHDRPGLIRHVVATSLGGYVAFLAIVLVFHVWIAGQRDALRGAVAGGGFLVAVAAAVFVVISWAVGRRAR